jgi:hypothetical protein
MREICLAHGLRGFFLDWFYKWGAEYHGSGSIWQRKCFTYDRHEAEGLEGDWVSSVTSKACPRKATSFS